YGQLSGYSAAFGGQSSIMACLALSSNTGAGSGFGSTFGGAGFGSNACGGGGFGGGSYGGFGFGGGGFGGPYGNNPYGPGPGYGGYGAGPYGQGGGSPFTAAGVAAAPAAAGAPGAANAGDLTGNYLGVSPGGVLGRGPRVVANPVNNTLLIQATPQEYESLEQLIRQLDVPPRQVLIEAKIYSIDLTSSTGTSVSGALTTSGSSSAPTSASLLAGLANGFGGVPGASGLSAAMLVGKSRELLGTVTLLEAQSKAKVLSAPSVIATDSI